MCLELIAYSKQKLIALVAYLYSITYIVELRFRVVNITHEWIEVAIGLAVLIGKVEREFAVVVAYTCRETMGVLPVGIVGCRSVVCAIRLQTSVLKSAAC